MTGLARRHLFLAALTIAGATACRPKADEAETGSHRTRALRAVTASPFPMVAAASTAAADDPLLAASPMRISATLGGVYRSPDGTLVVEIPPGALVDDATVRFARVDPEGLAGHPHGTLALVVAGDWGGARFKPGATFRVKGRVGDRFLRAFRAAAPGTDPAVLGLQGDDRAGWQIMLTSTADPLGRPDSLSSLKVGAGQLIHAAEMPQPAVSLAPDLPFAADPDMLPSAPTGVATLTPLDSDDPLVRRYPPLPADKAYLGDYHSVEAITGLDGASRIPVKDTVAASLGAKGAILACMLSDCPSTGLKPLTDALRFNKAVVAHRLPPAALHDRVWQPADLECH